MIIVPIKFTSIDVVDHNRDELTIRINFNDGSKDRFIEKKLKIDFDANALTDTIMAEARKMGKELNAKNTGDFLNDIVTVRIEDDEDVDEKIYNTLNRIKEEGRKLKTAKVAQNYLQNMSRFKESKFNL